MAFAARALSGGPRCRAWAFTGTHHSYARARRFLAHPELPLGLRLASTASERAAQQMGGSQPANTVEDLAEADLRALAGDMDDADLSGAGESAQMGGIAAAGTVEDEAFETLIFKQLALDKNDAVVQLFEERAASGRDMRLPWWNCLFEAYSRNRVPKEHALSAFEDMKGSGLIPAPPTFDSLIKCIRSADPKDDVRDAEKLLDDMRANSLRPTPRFMEAIMSLYFKAGDAEGAARIREQLYELSPGRCWAVGCAVLSRSKRAWSPSRAGPTPVLPGIAAT